MGLLRPSLDHIKGANKLDLLQMLVRRVAMGVFVL